MFLLIKHDYLNPVLFLFKRQKIIHWDNQQRVKHNWMLTVRKGFRGSLKRSLMYFLCSMHIKDNCILCINHVNFNYVIRLFWGPSASTRRTFKSKKCVRPPSDLSAIPRPFDCSPTRSTVWNIYICYHS